MDRWVGGSGQIPEAGSCQAAVAAVTDHGTGRSRLVWLLLQLRVRHLVVTDLSWPEDVREGRTIDVTRALVGRSCCLVLEDMMNAERRVLDWCWRLMSVDMRCGRWEMKASASRQDVGSRNSRLVEVPEWPADENAVCLRSSVGRDSSSLEIQQMFFAVVLAATVQVSLVKWSVTLVGG